jgi:hypothetical protein
MKRFAAIVLLTVATPVSSAAYKVVLSPPAGTQVVRGYGGLHAVDDRTDTTLVRVISPGSNIKERGTIRVLVMNKGTKTFPFGPDQVRLELADGTRLKPVPIGMFINKAELMEREVGRARAVDQRNRGNLSELARQSGGSSVSSGPTGVSAAPTSGPIATEGLDLKSDDLLLPGAKTLDAIYQVLETQPVAANQGWGGYYVFNMPKAVRDRKSDLSLTIVVTTGAEVRRFNATLQYR